MMILAVFRARAHSLDYAERLNAYGIVATLATIPREVKIGCGICVQFDARFFYRAQAILATGKYSSFKGFYRMEYFGGRMSVIPYYP